MYVKQLIKFSLKCLFKTNQQKKKWKSEKTSSKNNKTWIQLKTFFRWRKISFIRTNFTEMLHIYVFQPRRAPLYTPSHRIYFQNNTILETPDRHTSSTKLSHQRSRQKFSPDENAIKITEFSEIQMPCDVQAFPAAFFRRRNARARGNMQKYFNIEPRSAGS